MNTYYKGTETSAPQAPLSIDSIDRDDNAKRYTADDNLAAAVNVALILSKPLLVTGDPGTGKTELAGHVAMALGLAPPARFDTKSTSQATELFYRFDSLARFHAANADKQVRRALDFISFGPLGKAILQTLEPAHPLFRALELTYPDDRQKDEPPRQYPQRSVVLIDEIDKAPRDFPNDLLDAIDNLRFNLRELEKDSAARLMQQCGSTDIAANQKLRPIVIITSNSEKNLPAPFLRRCVYFHIPFPEEKRLLAIVARRVNDSSSPSGSGEALTTVAAEQLESRQEIEIAEAKPLLRTAMEFFGEIRKADLRKNPSTAELIDWMRLLLRAGVRADQGLKSVPALVRQSLGVLVKSVEDLDTVKAIAKVRFPEPPV